MNLINSKLLTSLLAVLSFWMLFSVISIEIERKEIKKEEKNIEAKINSVNNDNENLEKYIKNFENQEFLDKEARLRLNYKISGEEVVFVHRDLNSSGASLSEDFSADGLDKFKEWLFNFFRH